MEKLTDSLRPRKFSEMVGSEVTVKTFKKYSKDFSFPNTVIFEGATGTGKTSLSGIIASLINCESPIKSRDGSHNPCGKCESCEDIISERYALDVIMKDGSDLLKDGVQALEAEAERGATYAKNKIFIIEEVQQINSKSAIGKLLKIVEKPRKNVYFILLTMDAKALLSAVKNSSLEDRLQVYKFKAQKPKVLSDYLMKQLEILDPKEEIYPDSFIDVITAISHNCNGSIRGAVQKFQRCLDSEIYTEDQLIEELEIVTEEKLESFITKLLEGSATALYELSKGDSISDIFNKMFYLMVDWKKSYLTNSYYNGDYEAKTKFFASNKNFNSLLDTFVEINRENTG
jgi:DNA polymerase III gamma/tau subunit